MSTPGTRAQLYAYNNANITSNGDGRITGQIVNSMNSQIIVSFGALGDTNVWTGANTFTGPVNITVASITAALQSLPNVQHGDAIPATGLPYWNSSGYLVLAQ